METTKSVAMNPASTTSITFPTTSSMSAWTIGLDRQFDILRELQSGLATRSTTYPPYNIIKLSEDRFQVELAVAGFSKRDIEVTVKNGVLSVVGSKPWDYTESNGEPVEYIHRGIAGRSFTQTFALGEYVVVTDAAYEDGILTISLERILPEELRERTIKIK